MIAHSCPFLGRNNMIQQTLVLILGLTFVASRPDPFYRKDYTYVDQFDTFYKLHWDLSGVSWGSAFLACDDEESLLFYPKERDEWTVVKNLVTSMKVKPNVSDIFVGIHDEFGLGQYITVDGLPTPAPILDEDQQLTGQSSCVTMDIENGSYSLDSCEAANLKPFVCKKKVVEPCPTVDTGYIYEAQVKKCYKINQRKKTWLDAMKTCFLEGGVLAVILNSAEAGVITRKIKKYEEPHFVGFHRLFPNGDFFTVKGHKFDDTYYTNWRNRVEDDTQNDCGVIVRYNNDLMYTRTRNCFQAAPFVCEMTPNI